MPSVLHAGTTIAHYRVVSRLGAGGMGEVYLARDETLERSVALKVIPPELVDNEERVRRFVQEARTASALNHPNIVTIYEIGRAEVGGDGEPGAAAGPGRPSSASRPVHYIAMELIAGETLGHKIHHEKTDLRTLLGFLAQAADGLAKAHAAGIVHRDIKPENIMISKDGFAKVLDFGLAKLLEPRESADSVGVSGVTGDATREGMLLGTISYMSPEQARGKSVDHRSDIFAFGSLLYEAATRRRAFWAETDIETLHRILNDAPAPIEQLNPQTPAVLRRLIRRCLAKNPEQRLQSMKDLAIELSEIVEDFETLPPSSSSGSAADVALARTRRMRLPARLGLGAALLAVLALAALGGRSLWQIARRGGVPPGAGMEMTRLTSDGQTVDAALSPDGRYLARVVREPDGTAIRVRQIATGSDVRVAAPGLAEARGIRFSPDGSYVYYISTNDRFYSTLWQVPALGGTPRKIAFDVDSNPAFSPGGDRIAFLRGDPLHNEVALMVATADGSQIRRLGTLGTMVATPPFALAWSPDGRRIAGFSFGAGGVTDLRLKIADAATGRAEPVGGSWTRVSAVVWLPDGKGLLITGSSAMLSQSQIWLVRYPGGQASRVTNDLAAYSSLSLSADGTMLATVQDNPVSNLWVTSASGGAARQLTEAAGPDGSLLDLATAAAGSVLAVRKRTGGAEIVAVSDSGNVQTLLSGPYAFGRPHLAPRAKLIVFDSNRGGRFHVWRMDADGNDPAQITGGDADQIVLDVSPDGRWIYYYNVQPPGIWRAPVRGGAPARIVSQIVMNFSLSPDGRTMAWLELEKQGSLVRARLVTVPADGGPGRRELPWGAAPDVMLGWSPDRRSITYVTNERGVGNLWEQPLDGSPPRPLTRFTSLSMDDHAWSADGKELFLLRGGSHNDAVLIRDFR